jgi:hypothetical protein
MDIPSIKRPLQRVVVAPMFSSEEIACALLLIAGLYLPTSIHEEQSGPLALLSFVVLLVLFSYLVWKHGTRRGAVTFIALPIITLMTACTLSLGPFRVGWGVVALFSLLAFLFVLDLRTVRAGRLVYAAFVLANILNIACGIAILVGNEWIGQFLPSFYSHFYPELVPNMIRVHRPVLTFSTHSLAGLFLYLFFWLNWETYKIRKSGLSILFAISELILLVALTSFTSLALATLAMAQMGSWLWKRSRRAFVAVSLCVVMIMMAGGRLLLDQLEGTVPLPELGVTLLNSDNNGPLVRYGSGGDLRPTMRYLYNNPLSPIGFATPSYVYIVDSGPLEYLLRGSVPLLMLIYFGLYRFLRYNLVSRSHALTLFFVIIAFETGFTAFTYFRTLYLLPFFVIYLKQIALDANRGLSFYPKVHQSRVANI